MADKLETMKRQRDVKLFLMCIAISNRWDTEAGKMAAEACQMSKAIAAFPPKKAGK